MEVSHASRDKINVAPCLCLNTKSLSRASLGKTWSVNSMLNLSRLIESPRFSERHHEIHSQLYGENHYDNCSFLLHNMPFIYRNRASSTTLGVLIADSIDRSLSGKKFKKACSFKLIPKSLAIAIAVGALIPGQWFSTLPPWKDEVCCWHVHPEAPLAPLSRLCHMEVEYDSSWDSESLGRSIYSDNPEILANRRASSQYA